MSVNYPPLRLNATPPENALNFVVDQLLPHAYLTILAGEPKCGKTAFATALAFAVALGEPFLGHAVQQGAVLWLSLEEGEDERAALLCHLPQTIRDRVHASPQEGLEPGHLPIYTVYSHAAIDTNVGLTHLRHACEALNPRLIVIDSLHASHSGRSLCDAWAARKTLQGLKRFCGPGAPAVLVLHHLGGTRYRRRVAESAQLATIASMFWLLEETAVHPQERRFILESRGRGTFANQHLHLKSAGPFDYEPYTPEVAVAPEPVKPQNPLDAMILEALEGSRALTTLQVAEKIRQNPGSVRNAMARLYTQGEISVFKIDSGTRYYNKMTLIRNASNAYDAPPTDDGRDFEPDDDVPDEQEPPDETPSAS